MIKVDPIRGFKSLRAINVFSTLMLGLKMVPEFVVEEHDDFLERVHNLPEDEKRRLFKRAVEIVELERGEVAACLSFVRDPNGVPYSSLNMDNLSHTEIINAVTEVCMEISRMEVSSLTEDEKKK